MLLRKTILAVALLLLTAISARCQDLKLTPVGRLFLDGAAFITHSDGFPAGVAMPEARLGVKCSYGMFDTRIEIGFDFAKVKLKDAWVMANFSPTLHLKAGHFLQPFGLQVANAATITSMMRPRCSSVFDPARQIGVMGIYTGDKYYAALSLAAENKATTLTADQLERTGWSAYTWLIYHPLHERGKIVHIAWSGAYLSPTYNEDKGLSHSSFELGTRFPTQVARIYAAKATVTDARSMFKFSPEMLLAYKNFALESQYYHAQVFRKNGNPDYKADGAYLTLSALLRGGEYAYSLNDGKLARPGAGALGLVFDYSFVDLNSGSISGGRINDYSLTLNWYINRYILWRFRAGYSHAYNRAGYAATDLTSFQTRFQILF